MHFLPFGARNGDRAIFRMWGVRNLPQSSIVRGFGRFCMGLARNPAQQRPTSSDAAGPDSARSASVGPVPPREFGSATV
jgi:hypothetical protein